MLTKEQNELVTQTASGTPMGDFMRRYWLPAFKAERLPTPGGAPIPLKLLGERLVAFRDHEGKVSILDEFCPHRQASLVIARNENCHLTCVYHGWKIDGDGNVLETPPEPAHSSFAQSVKQPAYATHESAGVVWVYMGPKEKQPPFPSFPFANLPEENVWPIQVRQYCNYLQGLEGDIEAAHASYLHYSTDEFERQSQPEAPKTIRFLTDPRPRHAVEAAPWGLQTMMRYETDTPGKTLYWVHPIVMPSYTLFGFNLGGAPTNGNGNGSDLPGSLGAGHCWVPIDDENHYVWTWIWNPDGPLDDDLRAAFDVSQRYSNADPDDDYAPRDFVDGRYVQHRDWMESGRSFSGYDGVHVQDLAVQHSMGPIVDRTREHLASEDMVVVQFRRYLLRALEDFQQGLEPLPALQEGMAHAEIDHRAVIAPSDAAPEDVFRNRDWIGEVVAG